MPTRRALMGAPLAAAALAGPAATAVGGFPGGFTWGFAASAPRTEGDAAGRGRSIWDDFADRPGAIKDGSSPAEGTDFARRFPEDLDLAAGRGGANAFRFSIAWPRVLPEGAGAPSAAGLAFYDRLLDAMLGRGLEPWPTLYHGTCRARCRPAAAGRSATPPTASPTTPIWSAAASATGCGTC